MSGYRPISKRGKPDHDLDTLHSEVMPWMIAPLLHWLDPFLWTRAPYSDRRTNDDFVDGLEMALRLREPLERKYKSSASKDIDERIKKGGTFGLDVAGYAVYDAKASDAQSLQWLLTTAGSAWEVTRTPMPEKQRRQIHLLTHRELAAAKAAIADVVTLNARSGQHLESAWKNLAIRNPNPNSSYDQAVKAVEEAAQSIVSPRNVKATLGTINRDMKAKPSKWTFALGNISLVIDMSERLWSKHIRHGTDVRPEHTLEEADAALHLAIPLVRYFSGGLILPARQPAAK